MVDSNQVKDPYGVLTADDFTNFQVQRQRVNDTYNLGAAQNQYQKNLLQLQYDQSVGDLKRSYAKGFRSLPSQYSRRGLLNSGIYAQGKQDFNTNYNTNLDNMTKMFNQNMGGIDLSNTQLGDVQRSSLSEIDMRDAARRATAYSLKMNGIGV